MPQPTTLRRAIKLRVRRLMLNVLSLRVTLVLVAVQMACFGLRYLFNGVLGLTLARLADYGDTASGVYVLEEGVNVIFRMDLMGAVAALSVTWTQLAVFLVVNLIIFLILSPLRLGALEVYWGMTRGKTGGKVVQIFQWFAQPARMLKAWAVEFCYQVAVGVLTFVAATPSLYLFYRFYSSSPTVTGVDFSRRMMGWSAEGLFILALLFGFWLNSLLLPVRYCLAAHPEYSLGQVFRRGFRSARGIRGSLYSFRLGYILWFILSRLTYGAMDLYALPYSSMGSMLFLQEAARLRDDPAAAQPVPAEPSAGAGADPAWPPVEWQAPPEPSAGDTIPSEEPSAGAGADPARPPAEWQVPTEPPAGESAPPEGPPAGDMGSSADDPFPEDPGKGED